MRIERTAVFALAFFIGSSAQADQGIKDYCRVTPSRADALDYPSKHAWDLFMFLNHPAIDEKIERGQPNCTLPIGTPGTTSVWETWRNGDSEVFLTDGSEPPHWNDTSLPDEHAGSIPEIVSSGAMKLTPTQGTEMLSFHDFADRTIKPEFSPDGVFQGSGGIGETRMNRATYEFIKRNCLWSKEGRQRYANAVLSGKKPPLSLPIDSMEVKAVWRDLSDPSIPEDRKKTYYTAEYNGKKFGLSSLHVLTKDLPNWFWATFHHVDSPENPAKATNPDNYGRPAELKGTIWENYALEGTQIDFVTPVGRPVILSDHFVEFGFQRSSCISCHSTANISPDGGLVGLQAKALCALNGSVPEIGLTAEACKEEIGEQLYKPGEDKLFDEYATPFARWFEVDGKPFFLQTDFLWSITFRGKREQSPPPSRCIW